MYMQGNDGMEWLLIPIVLFTLYQVLVVNKRIERKEKAKKVAEEEMKRQNRNRERFEPVVKRKGTQKIQETLQHTITVKPTTATIPTVNVATDWFIDKWVADMKISPAEQLIIDELNKYPVQWHREVFFREFVSPKNAHYRYDFFIPSMRLCCEYHGKFFHMDDDKMATDAIKEEFCKVNNIRLVVYRGKDYYHMEQRIKELLA